MKIGFDAKRYLNNTSGLGNYSRELVHAYAKTFPNDELFLISEDPKDADRIHEIKNISFVAPNKKTRWFRAWHCYKLINALGLDIYHGLSNEIPFSHKKIKAKLVCTIHDVIFKYYPNYYKWWDRYIYHRKTRNAMLYSDLIVTTSDTTGKDLIKWYPQSRVPSSTIYQSINQAYRLNEPKVVFSERPHFIYVSSFTQRKNHATLIEAFNLIKNQTKKNLVLIGQSGSELEPIKRLIASYHLEARIKIHINAKTSFIKESIRDAVAFIYPSFYEGFGIPLIESAFLETAIAASNIGIFNELSEDSIIYFHPNKPEEIADAMLRLEDKEVNYEQTQKLNVLRELSDPLKASHSLNTMYKKLLT